MGSSIKTNKIAKNSHIFSAARKSLDNLISTCYITHTGRVGVTLPLYIDLFLLIKISNFTFYLNTFYSQEEK